MLRSLFGKTYARISLENFLKAQADGSGLTLDIGARDSRYNNLFPRHVGIDIAPNSNIDAVADAHALPFADEVFDTILCTEVLEHLHSPHIAVAEMNRVLKKGGKLLLTTPFMYVIHDAPVDYYRYTRYGLQHLFRSWKVESIRESTDDFTAMIMLFYYWIGKQKGVLWKLPKLLFLIFWMLWKNVFNLRLSRSRPGDRPLSPEGYHLVARKLT